jgi:hypothetical protein
VDSPRYLRVSTREQGRSGLGLAAQHHKIEVFGARESSRSSRSQISSKTPPLRITPRDVVYAPGAATLQRCGGCAVGITLGPSGLRYVLDQSLMELGRVSNVSHVVLDLDLVQLVASAEGHRRLHIALLFRECVAMNRADQLTATSYKKYPE